jgi:hypothetical protein
MRFARRVLRTATQTMGRVAMRKCGHSDAPRPMVSRRRNPPSLWSRRSRDSTAPFHHSCRGPGTGRNTRMKSTRNTVLPKSTAVRRKSYKLHSLGKLTATLCLLFALALDLHSQVTVSANLTDGTGATYRTAYLHFQLLNCGDIIVMAQAFRSSSIA